MTSRVVDNIAREGSHHREVALEDDPIFFWIYVSFYAILWIAFAIWLMWKAKRFNVAR
jgi:hypothetical protein